MSRTVCGTCWAPYIEGKCECEPAPPKPKPQRTLTDEKSDQALRKRVEGWYQHTLDCMERLKAQNSGKELLTPEFTNHMSNASILKKILEVKDA